MDDTSGIWEYIERNMKITVPKYMKLILMYCGYNDCYTISKITQTDLSDMVTEVRQGNVTNFYSELGISDAMEGSREPAESFKFILGHERLLMVIVNFVKQRLCDYGASILIKDALKIGNEHLVDVELSKDVHTISPLNQKFVSHSGTESHYNICKVHEDVIKHQHTLLMMALISLSVHTPKMYEENIEIVAHRISRNLVRVITLNPCDQPQYSARLICPYCFDVISVIHNKTWIISTFDHHLQNDHRGEEKIKSKNAKELVSGFADLNLNKNSLEHKNGKQISIGQADEESVIFMPKLRDYVLCSLKKCSIQWPSSVPLVKYYVGQVLSVGGTIKISILKRKDYSKSTFLCLEKEDTRIVAQEEIIKILEVPARNRRNHLVFKDKILSEI